MHDNEPPKLNLSPLKLSPINSVLIAASVVGLSYLMVIGLTPSRFASSRSEAEEAIAYLRDKKPAPLSGDLKALLADTRNPRITTEKHPLLDHPAPAFTLNDTDDHPASLELLLPRGPVVLVFYYGYSCNHCVSQLFDLNEDLKYFRELGATVVAIGPDMSENTRKKYAEYGAFGYPVLADVNRVVAARYGLYRPAVGTAKEWQSHGTFVIDRTGIVRWAKTGSEPFTGNVTLLSVLLTLVQKN